MERLQEYVQKINRVQRFTFRLKALTYNYIINTECTEACSVALKVISVHVYVCCVFLVLASSNSSALCCWDSIKTPAAFHLYIMLSDMPPCFVCFDIWVCVCVCAEMLSDTRLTNTLNTIILQQRQERTSGTSEGMLSGVCMHVCVCVWWGCCHWQLVLAFPCLASTLASPFFPAEHPKSLSSSFCNWGFPL